MVAHIWTQTMFGPLIIISFLLAPATARFRIGRVSGPGDDERLTTQEFWLYNSSNPVESFTERVRWWNTLDVAVAVCRLADQRVDALVLDGPPRLRSLVEAYSEHLQMPSVGGTVSVIPDTSGAAAQLIQQWKSFAFIYETEQGPNQLQSILRRLEQPPHVEAFWRTNGALETMEFAKNLPPTVPLLLACSKSLADGLLSRLAILMRNLDIVLLTPVGRVYRRLHPGSYRFVQFSFMKQESHAFKNFENRWNTIKANSKPDISESAILNYEASSVLQRFFSTETARSHSETFSSCFNYTAGFSSESLKRVETNGLTGDIRFDASGNRKGAALDIYEEMPFDMKKIGSWSDEEGLQLLQSDRHQVSPVSAAFLEKRPMRITSVLVEPFLFEGKSGNLEGYVVDLLEELKSILKLPYAIQLVKDGKYGYRDNKTGEWNGMVGELIRNEADMVVAPLTKTRTREEVIDFSKSFMTFGQSIILKRSTPQEKSVLPPFTFLSIWSAEMWVVLVVCVCLLAAACYLLSRYIGPPDRVRALESKGTDNLSPCGSFWFTLASMVQRDTGIYPRTFSQRGWACLWWGLCFFLAVGYISYLNAYLLHTRNTITTTHSAKTSQQVIQDLMEKGSPDIGVVKSGSTMKFFLNSNIGLYQRFGRYLESHPEMMMSSYDAGAKRVRESGGSYAFIMESPGSDYFTNTEPCDIVTSSGFLSSAIYAVAVPKGSPFKYTVDYAILQLTERGILRRLYEKWWHNSSSCEDPNFDILQRVYSKSLTLSEVSGLFYILILLAVVSVAVAFVEKRFSSAKQLTLD